MLDMANIKINRFKWDDMEDFVKNELRGDWVDALFSYELPEVKAAIKSVIADSKGTIKAINEHHVVDQIEKARKKEVSRLPSMEPEAAQARCTPEEMQKRKALAEELLGKIPSERNK